MTLKDIELKDAAASIFSRDDPDTHLPECGCTICRLQDKHLSRMKQIVREFEAEKQRQEQPVKPKRKIAKKAVAMLLLFLLTGCQPWRVHVVCKTLLNQFEVEFETTEPHGEQASFP